MKSRTHTYLLSFPFNAFDDYGDSSRSRPALSSSVSTTSVFGFVWTLPCRVVKSIEFEIEIELMSYVLDATELRMGVTCRSL